MRTHPADAQFMNQLHWTNGHCAHCPDVEQPVTELDHIGRDTLGGYPYLLCLDHLTTRLGYERMQADNNLLLHADVKAGS